MTKVRSAKGTVVDFDLMRVKRRLESTEKGTGVSDRETYVDVKRRRTVTRSPAEIAAEQAINTADVKARMAQSKRDKAKLDEAQSTSSVDAPTTDVDAQPRTSGKRIAERTKKPAVKKPAEDK